MKVTAVLLKYKRPRELKAVVRDLERYDFIGEIIVHNNGWPNRNIINYGRYLAASNAKFPVVYTQDDDCIVENLEELYETFVAMGGQSLVNGMKAERMRFYTGRDTMAGWGMFFRREWTEVLKIYTDRFGFDPVFYRETDRIFTSLLNVPRYTIEARIRDFPSAMAGFSLSLQPDHEAKKRAALDRCGLIRGEVLA